MWDDYGKDSSKRTELAFQFVPIKVYGGLMLLPHLPAYKNCDLITFIVSCLIMWAFVGFVRLVSNRAHILLGGRKIKE